MDPISVLGAIGGFLSAIVAIIIAYLAYGQLRLSRKEMATTFRPWIGSTEEFIKVNGVVLVDGTLISLKELKDSKRRSSYEAKIKSISFQTQLKNYGQIPALDITTFFVYSNNREGSEKEILAFVARAKPSQKEQSRITKTLMPGESFPYAFELGYEYFSGDAEVFLVTEIKYRYGDEGKGLLKQTVSISSPLDEGLIFILKETAE